MGFSIIYKAKKKEYHSLYFKILLIDKSIRMLLLFGINICKMANNQKKNMIRQKERQNILILISKYYTVTGKLLKA